MPFDTMIFEVLPDGTIKTTTDAVSKPNHDNAEQFLRATAKLAGGKTTRERRKGKHGHVHHHEHGGTHHEH